VAAHEAIEEGGGLVADAEVAGPDTGEGGVGDFTERFVVVHAEDGNFVRDADGGTAAGFEDLRAALVAADHDAGGFGEVFDPGGEIIFDGFPGGAVGGVAGKVINRRRATGMTNGLDKSIAASQGPVFPCDAKESEVAKAAFEEVFGGHACDRGVIHMHEGKLVGDDAKDVHHGHTGLANGLNHGLVLKAGDDAMALPAAKPAGWRVFEAAGFVVEGPGLVLANVAGQAAEDVASGGERGFDEEGDLAATLMAGGGQGSHRRSSGPRMFW